jgi:hypothetical protein
MSQEASRSHRHISHSIPNSIEAYCGLLGYSRGNSLGSHEPRHDGDPGRIEQRHPLMNHTLLMLLRHSDSVL